MAFLTRSDLVSLCFMIKKKKKTQVSSGTTQSTHTRSTKLEKAGKEIEQKMLFAYLDITTLTNKVFVIN